MEDMQDMQVIDFTNQEYNEVLHLWYTNIFVDDFDYTVSNVYEEDDVLKIDVTFQKEGNKKLKKIYYYVDAKNVYNNIKEGENIDISGCYIKDFDYSDCDNHIIKNFTAKYTFFDGTTDFSYAKFDDGLVSFECSNFGKGDLNFNYTDFEHKGVSFENTHFGNCNVNFNYVNFGDSKVSFIRADFGKSVVNFYKTNLDNAKVNFFDATINTLNIENVTFENDIKFNFENIHNLILKSCHIKSDLYLNKASDKSYIKYDKLSFSNTKNDGTLHIKWKENNVDNAINNYFESYIDDLKSSYENNHKKAQEYNWEEDSSANKTNAPLFVQKSYHEKKLLTSISNNPKILTQLKNENYKFLKFNFKKLGENGDVDKVHVKYMDTYFDNKGLKIGKILGVIGGYGTNPLSICIVSEIIIILFAILYLFSGMQFIENNGVSNFIESIHFSAMTFLTAGYAHIMPTTTISYILIPIEAILGIFFIVYFVVCMYRKIAK